MKNILTSIVAMFLLFSTYAQLPELQLDLFSSGYTSPVDIASCGDSRLFIVEKAGIIWICDAQGNKFPKPFLDIHTKVLSSGSEQGLLGLAFHPDYANNGYFYVNYINQNGDTRISRYSVNPNNPNRALKASELILLKVKQPFSNHNGGCLKFGPNGYLYAGLGDGGSANDPQNNGQKTSTFLGKILRIDVDGGSPYAVPPTNPFINNPNYKPEIWAVGTRNPWRFSFDDLTGDLYIADVGQGTWEEVNYQLASSTGGENYGWRCYEGNHEFITSGCAPATDYDFPVAEYKHTGGDCSITGGFVYRGSLYPNMYGKYFCVDYCSGKFRTIYFDGAVWQNTVLLTSTPFQYVTFGQDMNKELYVAKISEGKIYHVTDISAKDGITSDQSQCSLYPNPNSGQFTVEWISSDERNYLVEIFDLAGRRMMAENKVSVHGLNSWHFSADALEAGNYILKIGSGEKAIVKKFTVE